MRSEDTFRYDAFISYSHRDKDWVQGWLLPRLEQAGLRICIDFRDFEPGLPSLVNMENAIERSHKTLIVLTPEWIASEWTTFESLLIQTDDPTGRRQRLIPLLLKPCTLPKRIAMLTYLDFSEASEIESQFARLVATVKPVPGAAAPTGTERQVAPTLLSAYLPEDVALVVETSVIKVMRSRGEPLYNRDEEIGLFQRILRGEDPRRSVVVHSHGERGWGKSSLLVMLCQECSKYEPSFTRTFLFPAHEVSVSWKLILTATADWLGALYFPRFSALLRSMLYSKAGPWATWRAGVRYGAVSASGLGYKTWEARVAEASIDQAPAYVPPEELQEQLTDLFLEELAALPEPAQVVWLVDTIEAVGPETQAWLSDMIGRIARQETDKVILVVAGRSPLPYDKTWKSRVCEIDLKGLPRDAIRQLAQSRRMLGTERTIEKLVDLLEMTTSGNPLKICSLLDSERSPIQAERG